MNTKYKVKPAIETRKLSEKLEKQIEEGLREVRTQSIEQLQSEIKEWEEEISNLSSQLCGDEDDEQYEDEISQLENLISHNEEQIRLMVNHLMVVELSNEINTNKDMLMEIQVKISQFMDGNYPQELEDEKYRIFSHIETLEDKICKLKFG